MKESKLPCIHRYGPWVEDKLRFRGTTEYKVCKKCGREQRRIRR